MAFWGKVGASATGGGVGQRSSPHPYSFPIKGREITKKPDQMAGLFKFFKD
jgi:hypothetical protein